MPEISDAELRQFVRFQSLGTPEEVEKKIRDLEKDNHSQREEIRDLKKAPTVPEGGRIVTKEEAEEIEAYRALGTPEDVKAAVGKVSDLEEQIAKRDREAAREKAARALGIEGSDLASFAGADTLTYEVREVEQNGEKRPVAFVKDADGEDTPLVDYGKKKWGRPFEAVLANREHESGAPGAGGTTYTLQTDTAKSGRSSKVTPEQQRQATRRTVNMGI